MATGVTNEDTTFEGMNENEDNDDDINLPREETKRPRYAAELIVKCVSASYGPCEGRRLLTGELSSDETASTPCTRDVAPFLRALLIAQQHREGCPDDGSDPRIIRLNAIAAGQGGMKRTRIRVMMKSMNAVFGDPCPGTSKRLHVHYLVREVSNAEGRREVSTEVHHMSFAEHERVELKRRVTFYQTDSELKQAAARAAAKKTQTQAEVLIDDDETTLMAARRMGRAQSIAEFSEDCIARVTLKPTVPVTSAVSVTSPPLPPRKWRLRSATSEIVLPIVMPFLEVLERVQCRLVCRLWRHIVRDWGVAETIDNNDPAFPRFTRVFLRGILAHSYSSLHSLFLSGSEDLQQSDLHPAIPHLRKLHSLDLSRCILLDDSTLEVLAFHVSETLEVLYIKGLRKVTDDGVISISRSCSKLKVLDVSNIPITDPAAIAIGQNLTNLRALYMRDNFLLTNRSMDVITEKCTHLEQLTLWGCIRLQHLTFDQPEKSSVFTSGNLVLLNLWGCHSLKDDSAVALAGMSNLRSLIVSECHRLTDTFLTALCQNTPQLSHLHLRYCKRITDRGIDEITKTMQDLYSLDLSFCTRVTVASLVNMLETRDMLAELRLHSCRHLDISGGPADSAGRMILSALRSQGNMSCLSVLDLRRCGGHLDTNEGYHESDMFVQGMVSLEFEQKVPGYFVRPARWNSDVARHLVEQFVSMKRQVTSVDN